ncbi:carbon-nitrogen hydrolase family protein [Xanthomonas sp. NCPPB 1067]|uniref:nitrilase-related carbon-nitrogen hydrolase n=1 Tax=Xanthomonas sp. NCPPB 1067 TaxID=487524 RepID=UPI001E433331|nr:carbon-nitrogen hydrolase family protein [Xanthomonas sp. NCPPB 1067]
MQHTAMPPSRLLPVSLATGAALWFGVGLAPAWWWVWLAPVPLLWLALSIQRTGQARVAVAIATLLAATRYASYFDLVMPLPAAVLATCGVGALWYVVVMTTRALVQRLRTGWSVLAYPLVWVTVDLLMAQLLPDGNWGSPAYTQAAVLPLLQLTAVTGVSGLLFVLCLLPSLLAVLLWRGHRVQRPVALAGAVILVLAAGTGGGLWRLQTPPAGTPTKIGLASIDEPINAVATPTYWRPIRDRYDAMIGELAAQGAQIVVLPEKIAVLPPAELARWQAHFAALARAHGLWLVVGIAEHGSHPHNLAWLFDPAGQRVLNYDKHFLAPPERAQAYASGTAYALHAIGDARFGLAICKDMMFARLARANGQRNAAMMLVPAWDFAYRDAWMSAHMTVLRGVENGYAVARNAREGWLIVSDAHGRVLAQTASAPLPGTSMLVSVPVGSQLPTLYTRVGDLFGWLCALAVLVLAGVAYRGAAGMRHAPADR